MQGNYSNSYNVPSFARREAYNFDDSKEFREIYKELCQISEEIEKCRSRNS